jgi:hypothetical protein
MLTKLYETDGSRMRKMEMTLEWMQRGKRGKDWL